MNRKTIILILGLWMACVQTKAQSASSQLTVQRGVAGGNIQLHLENAEALFQGGAWLQLQRSVDLVHWEDLVAAPSSTFVSDSSLVYEETGGGNAFFRLLINQRVVATASTTASAHLTFSDIFIPLLTE